jgi:hypothetical protein
MKYNFGYALSLLLLSECHWISDCEVEALEYIRKTRRVYREILQGGYTEPKRLSWLALRLSLRLAMFEDRSRILVTAFEEASHQLEGQSPVSDASPVALPHRAVVQVHDIFMSASPVALDGSHGELLHLAKISEDGWSVCESASGEKVSVPTDCLDTPLFSPLMLMG